MADVEIGGHCDEKFAAAGEAFEKNFRRNEELGGAFALAVEGEFVVDLWGGFADRHRQSRWHEDTIVPVSSNTKIMAALCGLMLLDRGLIDLDEPVATYWPEFASNGKANVTVRHLFCHASGVAGFDPPFEPTDLFDWDQAVNKLARQAPWWEPGTVSGYHSMTFGFLLGELVRRTTGMDFQTFFISEITDKLNADFHIGLPETARPRLAEVVSNGTRREIARDSMAYRAEIIARWDPDDLLKMDGFLAAVIPSANGIGNARSLVKIGSVLANGGSLDGVRLLSRDTCELAYQEQIYTHDLVMDMPVRFGLGFGLVSPEFPLPFPNGFHWGGYGGSSTIMEPDRGACFAYVTNYFDSTLTLDSRAHRLNSAACRCLMAL